MGSLPAGASLVGEVLRRTKGGRFIGYYLRFYEGGRRRILASRQASHAEARRMLVEIEARIARGERGIAERPKPRPTVRELTEEFLSAYSRPSLKDVEAYRYLSKTVLQKVLRHIGKLPVGEVTQRDLGRMQDALAEEYEPGTIRTAMGRLSAVFSWGVREGRAPANPCRGLERPRQSHSLDFYSREEVQKLLQAAELRARSRTGQSPSKMLYVGITLAVHTGLRKGEVLGLRWSDVDLETQRLTVARSYGTTPKGGKPRHLRLPKELVPILRAWREECGAEPGGAVLPVGRNDSRFARERTMLGIRTLMQEVGLRTVKSPWHILRHTFASHFVMSGGNLLALQRILGHSDVKMTMIYAHLAPDFLGSEMERVSYRR